MSQCHWNNKLGLSFWEKISAKLGHSTGYYYTIYPEWSSLLGETISRNHDNKISFQAPVTYTKWWLRHGCLSNMNKCNDTSSRWKCSSIVSQARRFTRPLLLAWRDNRRHSGIMHLLAKKTHNINAGRWTFKRSVHIFFSGIARRTDANAISSFELSSDITFFNCIIFITHSYPIKSLSKETINSLKMA